MLNEQVEVKSENEVPAVITVAVANRCDCESGIEERLAALRKRCLWFLGEMRRESLSRREATVAGRELLAAFTHIKSEHNEQLANALTSYACRRFAKSADDLDEWESAAEDLDCVRMGLAFNALPPRTLNDLRNRIGQLNCALEEVASSNAR